MRRLPATALALVGTALVVAAVLYGPTAVDVWHFTEDIKERRAQGAANRGASIAVTCNHCHGENGNSRNDFYPALAGLPADYLLAQMKAFSSGRRDSPHMRPLAIYLSDDDLKAVSAHFEKQSVDFPGQDAPVATSPAIAARLQTCVVCHGPSLQGVTGPGAAPRLAGQGYTYVLRQLEAFHTGTRVDATGAMAAFAKTLDRAELGALAKAASAQRPGPP